MEFGKGNGRDIDGVSKAKKSGHNFHISMLLFAGVFPDYSEIIGTFAHLNRKYL
jgi:hypothetical protein